MPATTATALVAQPKAERSAQSRAPKGGMVDQRTGVFYRGGCFVPTLAVHELAATASPAPLTGSYTQKSWANRLRTNWLARLDAKLAALRGQLDTATRKDGVGIRAEIRRVEGKRWRLWIEGDAATIVGRHVAQTMAASGVAGLRLAECA